MMHKYKTIFRASLVGAIGLGLSSGPYAQTVTPTTASPSQSLNDDFTQANDANSWKTFDGACLTAGDGTGSIPACVGLPYYKGQVQVGGNNGFLGNSSSPTGSQTGDTPGTGALRFTNGFTAGHGGNFMFGYKQAGSIISSGTPFATGAGLQVVFKTITYRGDNGNGDGADGIGFFLMDGALNPYDTGAFGGSLGYTCSNTNNDPTLRADGTVRGFDGLAGGYIGLGIDEFGNFLNPGDNTHSGPNQTPGRIGVRGSGSISWAALSTNPATAQYYPLTLSLSQQQAAVQNTCKTGLVWDYTQDDPAPAVINTGTRRHPINNNIQINDYPAFGNGVILSSILPGKNISNISAIKRSDGVPITYSLKITQDGILSLNIAYNGGTYLPVITKQSITAANGPLPSSFRFGFTGSTGGSTNVHELLCFQAAPSDIAGTSVGVNEQEATKIASGTQAYLAFYFPGNWTGSMTANDLVLTTSQTIDINPKANWDAQCNLTGVPSVPAGQTCASTGAGPSGPQTPASSRVMLTFDDSARKGVAFRWDSTASGSSINSTQQSTLDAGDPTPINANRLNFLRGDRSNEIDLNGNGLFRSRDGVLADIIDSSPTWVGPPTAHYTAKFKDLLVATDPTPENTSTQSFAQYVLAEQTRLNVVYAGSNDGFIHGFRTGSFDVSGNYVNNGSTPNDGQEVLAYMPAAVLNTIHNSTDGTLDYAGSQYSHNFFVDATPDVDDVFYQSSWHTWLVGGLGAGGAAIYMLDVTNPDPVASFNEGNAKNLVMGEWSSATIGCQNDTSTVLCKANMGNTYGTPIVRRLHDGKWAVIFGNGFGSSTGDAGIFIMLIDSNGGTQASNTYYLSTHQAAGANDGIAYVSSADLDGDHITDYVYAGDLLGNIWRFDLTSPIETVWAASSTPLFSAPAGQPITTKVQVIGVPQGSGPQRLMIDFGTGQKFPTTALIPTTYETGTQFVYGIWDWNMAVWNGKSSTKYLSMPAGLPVPSSSILTQTNLTSQTLSAVGDGSLDITSNVVCWAGTTTCASNNVQFGFQIALPGTQEQVVFNPLVYQNELILNTTIPAINSPSSCTINHDTGNTLVISLLTGGALGSSTGGSIFLNTTDTNSAGSQTNGSGTPFVALAGGKTYILTQTLGDGAFPPGGGTGGGTATGPINCAKGSKICSGSIQSATLSSKRLTWIERR
ncbi:MAG: PilC/PilY family type IV pilus protein [Pseudomonadota bacterium]|nr:PilC/PilY family type IV pilus protein [Pseudomonadota bacterium]